VLAHLKNTLPQLSQAERYVGEWVLESPVEAADATLQEWATIAQVSAPTVVRFCKSVNNSSFAAFKRKLNEHLVRSQVFVHTSIRPDDTGGSLTHKLFDSAIASLVSVRDSLPGEHVDQAIAILNNAARVEIYGLGGSGLVASDAAQKLFRLGKPVAAWADPHVHRVSAALLDPSAAVIAISTSGETSDLNASVQDSDLYAPIKARLAQLAVIDVLAIGLACTDPETHNERLRKAIQALEHHRHPKK